MEKKGAAMAVTFWKLLEGSLGAGLESRRGVRGSCHSAETARCFLGSLSSLITKTFFFVFFCCHVGLSKPLIVRYRRSDERTVGYGGAPVVCPRRLAMNVAACHWFEYLATTCPVHKVQRYHAKFDVILSRLLS